MHRFFAVGNFVVGQSLILSREESHHLAKVMRIKNSEEVEIVDGIGGLARAQVEKADPNRSELRILFVDASEISLPRIHLAFALPKSAALDFIIRRCTEIGVASFQPLTTQHSIHGEWNQERWSRVVSEVAKQCQERFFPAIHPTLSLTAWLKTRPKRPLVFCTETQRLSTDPFKTDSSIDLLLGSEGGWSQGEIQDVMSHQAVLLGLGKNRLRAETAALVSTILLKKELGEFSILLNN